MKIKKMLQQIFYVYKQGFGRIILMNLWMQFLLVIAAAPILDWLLAEILSLNGVDYVSYNNLSDIYTNPLLVVLLIFFFLLFITVIYLQFSYMFLYFQNMINNDGKNWYQLVFVALSKLKKIHLKSFLFLILYFIFVIPFGSLFLKTSLLSKFVIPSFTYEYFYQKPTYLVLLVCFLVVIFYIGLRLIYVLPNFILTDSGIGQAIRDSIKQTKKQEIKLITKGIVILGLIAIVTFPIFTCIYFLQNYLDKFVSISFITAVINMGFLQVISQIISGWGLTGYLLIVMNTQVDEKIVINPGKKRRLLTGLLLGFLALSTISYNIAYLKGVSVKRPLTISHRGVNGENGVQNTIPALLSTIESHPDYVEMDVYETKDNDFVVMHDSSLMNLAGIDRHTYDMTLSELKETTVRENGMEATIAGFDDYYAAAREHNQKLLIEIKTTKYDSKDFVKNFLDKYGDEIIANGDEIHSFDYGAIEDIKKFKPDIFVSFILPFNLSFPNTVANAYTMEQSTITSSFIQKANLRQKKVYVWTINTDIEMEKMIFLGADGIITDNLSTLQTVIKENIEEPSYATQILNYMNQSNPNAYTDN